ncbi:MAG TPA: PBP1A family penicillin-binding protein [Thermoanaerobaculia bacterium]|nr:PBP1A family penicillin-binding protein [Thermoanaerobaculia bacterium]HUM31182.1 PBP1A family penicillin-binding protein [Thermoanaerobaculia bacterium]HXK69518.1 PBP1A family penicillin-binding protein [Thermoanaerobaculia bacterium]
MRRSRKILILLALPILLGALAGVLTGRVFEVPKVEGVTRLAPPRTTQLYARDGKIFARYAIEERIPLRPDEIPFMVRACVLAAEDSEFYTHGGIHIKSIVRAILSDIRSGSYSQGGSTITQQLARELYLTKKKTIKRKIEEAILTFDLEKRLTKDEILAMYCNMVYLGSGSYGIAAASKRYFNKSPDQLLIHQAALLAGLPQGPSRYNPFQYPDRAIGRRNWVIQRLQRIGYLTAEQAKQIQARPLDLRPENPAELTGKYFAEEIRRHLERTYGPEALYQQGLQVQTTLDMNLQRVAEAALKRQLHVIDEKKGYRAEGIVNVSKENPDLQTYRHSSWRGLSHLVPDRLYDGLVVRRDDRTATVRIASFSFTLEPSGYDWIGKPLNRLLQVGDIARFYLNEDKTLRLSQVPLTQGAVVVLDNASGQVLAMVGGYDFSLSEWNRATQAMRQPGSAFKPFVYATALEQGWSWADTIFDSPIYLISETGNPDYSPTNYYKRYYGIVTLRDALERSLNVCAVKLFLLVGPENVIRTAKACGITSSIPPYASSALGAADITPMELTAAYTVFPNLGTHVEPYLITSITRNGALLEQHAPETTASLHPTIAYLTSSCLEGVIQRGTGVAARSIPLPLAGKTGTTNAYTDAWFVGYSPSYTVGVWVGNETKIPLGKRMPGAEAALPVWKSVMEYIAREGLEPVESFSVPPGLAFARIDRTTGLLASSSCPSVIQEAFLPGTQPTEICSDEWHRIIQLPYYLQFQFYEPKPGEIMGTEYTEKVRTLIEEGYFDEEKEGENH